MNQSIHEKVSLQLYCTIIGCMFDKFNQLLNRWEVKAQDSFLSPGRRIEGSADSSSLAFRLFIISFLPFNAVVGSPVWLGHAGRVTNN